MTYQINPTTSMVLTDICDTFTTDYMLIFMVDGKEVPVSVVIPSIQRISIQDNPIADALDVELTGTDGQVSTFTLPDVAAVIAYLMDAVQPSTEPAEAVPAAQVTDDTTRPRMPLSIPCRPLW